MGQALIGRERELGAVEAFLDGLAAAPAALVLEGEPGAGKTELWRAGVAAARERGYRVLACRPAEAERRLSFAGLGDLLAPVVDDALPALPEPQRRALRVALLLVEAGDGPPDQRAISLALLGLLRLLAEDGPLLVAVDDLQWLDPPSARALRFALRRLEREPVGLLTAQRPGEEAVALEPDGARRLPVGPLSAEQLGRLLDSRLGLRPPRPALARLHRTCAGNPLYALELARSAPGPEDPLRVPDDLRNLLRRRIARLPESERESLLVAAAASHPTVGLLRAAGAGGLDEAIEREVVEVAAERIRFTHPLLASVVYAEASEEARRRVHRALAGVATEEERARHLARAVEGADAEVAGELERAAAGARSRGAPDAAAELAEEALRLLPEDDREGARRLRLFAAEAWYDAGDSARSLSLLEEALAAAAPGPERGWVLWHLGNVRGDAETTAVGLELHRAALEDAGDDPALLALLHQRLSVTVGLVEEMSSAEPHARAAAELAERIGDPVLLAQTLAGLASLQVILGRPLDEPLFERALAFEERVGDAIPIDVRPRMLYGRVLFWLGRLDDARRSFEPLRTWASERGDASVGPLFGLGYVEVRAGDWELATRLADEGLELTRQGGRDVWEPPFQALKTWAEAHLGRVEEARAAGEEALAGAVASRQPGAEIQALSALGFLDLSLERHEEAVERLARAADVAAAGQVGDPAMYAFRPDLIEALATLGALDRAEAVLEPFAAKGEELDRPWVLATASRCRGLLATARGSREEALAAFDAALREHERTEQPFDTARTLLARGSSERSFRQKRAARSSLEQAAERFDELGARLWAERARSELARVGGRPARPGALTPTEARIAELVAAGNTNRQVADALFMSPKTVEWNLSKVYRKLRVGSRTELATRLARR